MLVQVDVQAPDLAPSTRGVGRYADAKDGIQERDDRRAQGEECERLEMSERTTLDGDSKSYEPGTNGGVGSVLSGDIYGGDGKLLKVR